MCTGLSVRLMVGVVSTVQYNTVESLGDCVWREGGGKEGEFREGPPRSGTGQHFSTR